MLDNFIFYVVKIGFLAGVTAATASVCLIWVNYKIRVSSSETHDRRKRLAHRQNQRLARHKFLRFDF